MLELVIILGLTNWRISSMLYSEQMFDWLRRWLKIDQRGSDDWNDWIYPDNFWGKLFGCFWCLSLAVAMILSIVSTVLGFNTIKVSVFVWLASAAVAIIAEKWIGRTKMRW